ncbi:LAQU0S05e06568g1_1 [Lachancea quebecensis]|uniref:LAQU0S05e06568g1_1 n=1 Tax=Lachancea quebecensis TaxID=1654605 RepID=A0A0P1KRZ4_9SACH|nr:LAQU0S05e06568g1_1 [Lachancea quebecensis]
MSTTIKENVMFAATVSLKPTQYTAANGTVVHYLQRPFYTYTPTVGGAAVFAVLFGISLVVLSVQVWQYGKQRTSMEHQIMADGSVLGRPAADIESRDNGGLGLAGSAPITPVTPCSNARLVGKFVPLMVGLVVEIGGYAARIVSHGDLYNIGPYVAQTVMLLVAPALMAATIYMNFGRLLILLRATKLSVVPARFNTTIFVLGDVLSFVLQAAGGGLLGASDQHQLGSNIVIAGLAIQVFVFGFFVATEVRFLMCAQRISPVAYRISRHWKVLNINLFVSSLLILVRSIVRLVEFAQGFEGYIMEHEWFIYVFDAVPMFLVVASFIIFFNSGNLFRVEFECTSMISTSRKYSMDTMEECIDR